MRAVLALLAALLVATATGCATYGVQDEAANTASQITVGPGTQASHDGAPSAPAATVRDVEPIPEEPYGEITWEVYRAVVESMARLPWENAQAPPLQLSQIPDFNAAIGGTAGQLGDCHPRGGGTPGVPSFNVRNLSNCYRPTLYAPLQTTIVPARGVGSTTYSRASISFQTDFEALRHQVASAAPRFEGSRLVWNFATRSESLDVAATWVPLNAGTGSAPVVTTGHTDPLGGTTAFRVQADRGAGDTGGDYSILRQTVGPTGTTWVRSIWAKSNTGSSQTFHLLINDAAHQVTATTAWRRLATPASAGTSTINVANYGPDLDTRSLDVLVWHPSFNDVTGATNQNPPEYVPNDTVVYSAPWTGANVSGVQYFSTLNGNTVASNVVTEATGAPIVTGASGVSAYAPVDVGGPFGYLSEQAATQLVTPTADISDMTQVTWPVVTMTTAFTSTGATGVANSATRLTATGANATILHVLVAAASSRTYSIWARRVTGTGTIKLFQGASKSADLASQLNTSTYTQLQFNANVDVTLLGYGIEIGTSGDAIDVWVNQFEAGSVGTSPITTAGATRVKDALTYVLAGNLSNTQGTLYAEITTAKTAAAGRQLVVADSTGTGGWAMGFNGTDQLEIFDNTTETVFGAAQTLPITSPIKAASVWGGSTQGGSVSGSAVTTGAFDGSLNLGDISIGGGSSATDSLNGTIRNVRTFMFAVPELGLAKITADASDWLMPNRIAWAEAANDDEYLKRANGGR